MNKLLQSKLMFSSIYFHYPLIFLGNNLNSNSKYYFKQIKKLITKFILINYINIKILLEIIDYINYIEFYKDIQNLKEVIELIRIKLLSNNFISVQMTIILVYFILFLFTFIIILILILIIIFYLD